MCINEIVPITPKGDEWNGYYRAYFNHFQGQDWSEYHYYLFSLSTFVRCRRRTGTVELRLIAVKSMFSLCVINCYEASEYRRCLGRMKHQYQYLDNASNLEIREGDPTHESKSRNVTKLWHKSPEAYCKCECRLQSHYAPWSETIGTIIGTCEFTMDGSLTWVIIKAWLELQAQLKCMILATMYK